VNERDFETDVNSRVWVNHFDELFLRNIESGVVLETHLLEPQHVEEFSCDFTEE
jgi:hypothetical protein